MNPTLASALVGIVAPLCGFGVLMVIYARERVASAREREEKMQSELVSVTKSVDLLADVIEKNSWKDAESHRAIQRSVDEVKHSLERLLDGRR